MGSFKALGQLCKRVIASPWLLLVMNAMIVLIAMTALADMLTLAQDTLANLTELENASDAVATIYIAYGVATEERGSLMEFSGVYPALRSPLQMALDHASHCYGLSLLVVGLFMEIGVQLIKLPDSIMNTNGLEYAIFGINALFILFSMWLLFWYSVRIVQSRQRLFRSDAAIFSRNDL